MDRTGNVRRARGGGLPNFEKGCEIFQNVEPVLNRRANLVPILVKNVVLKIIACCWSQKWNQSMQENFCLPRAISSTSENQRRGREAIVEGSAS